ncbi:hypothetical protein LZL87_002886 [Fusarium oxysporum]|nr:hypothetical protein LZL87_002886 [Fusarium oxysporum]
MASAAYDHSKVDALNVSSRRIHMEAFFKHLGLWNSDKVAKTREKCVEMFCQFLNKHGYTSINQQYFEYEVDALVWYNILKRGKVLTEANQWPWSETIPKKVDLTTNDSLVYREWLRRKSRAKVDGDRGETNHPTSSKAEEHQVPALSSRRLVDRITKEGDFHSKPCANCEGQGHLLAGCITSDGFIKVCFFCEDNSHHTDACDSFKRLSLAEKVKLLVTDRAGKPGLATDRPWWSYLYQFLQAKETEGISPPTAFPWTASFAREVFAGERGKPVKDIQAEFDSTNDPAMLPVDTTVRSLPDVWSFYWYHEDLPFPRRAHILRM